MPERTQRPASPAPWGPKEGDSGGPKSPDVSKPDVKDLLQRMRRGDPNQSRRSRQRTGEKRPPDFHSLPSSGAESVTADFPGALRRHGLLPPRPSADVAHADQSVLQ